jgi:hypothetical protein
VYRWLLERNTRSYVVSYALDTLGDVFLVGRIPLHAVTPEELDRLLGARTLEDETAEALEAVEMARGPGGRGGAAG